MSQATASRTPVPTSDPPSRQLKADTAFSRLAIHQVPQQFVLVAAFVSYLVLGIAYLQGVVPWLAFGLALAPWLLIVLVETKWAYKHFHWFALFGFMGFVQLIHYSEHCIEIIQYHIFHDSLKASLAIFGSFNVEWVHFLGDSFLTIGALVLLTKFPRNPWLWLALPFQILHQAEHTFLIFNYVFKHVPGGGPGLLAHGGAIGGGLNLVRPDLHWIYNTLFTIPFVLAFVYQLRRTYDESLDEAFPEVAKSELVSAAKHLETFHYAVAETVLAPGDDADRLYIITEGEAGVYAREDGVEVELATLHHGQYFGEIGLLVPGAPHTKIIRAKTPLTVLAMDEQTFRHLMSTSQSTETHLSTSAAARVVSPRPRPTPTRTRVGASKH